MAPHGSYNLMIRLKEEDHTALKKLAERTRASVAGVARTLIADGLERLQAQENARHQATEGR